MLKREEEKFHLGKRGWLWERMLFLKEGGYSLGLHQATARTTGNKCGEAQTGLSMKKLFSYGAPDCEPGVVMERTHQDWMWRKRPGELLCTTVA